MDVFIPQIDKVEVKENTDDYTVILKVLKGKDVVTSNDLIQRLKQMASMTEGGRCVVQAEIRACRLG